MEKIFIGNFKIEKLKLIVFIGIVGFISAVIYHYVLGFYLNFPWPYNSFLFTPADKFMDFYHAWIMGRDILAGSNPYVNGFPFVYFPFAAFAILPFSFGNWYTGLIIFSLLIIAVFGWFLYQAIKGFENYNLLEKAGCIILLAITSYPLLFVLDRGNVEGLFFIFLCFFIYFYQKGRFLLSIIPLSLAICMKLYPLVFIVLLISDKRYKETIFCVLLSLGITLSSLLLMKGNIFFSVTEFMKDLLWFKNWYIIGNSGASYNHSLFNVFKIINSHLPIIKDLNVFSSLYTILVFTIFGLIALYIIFAEKKLWRKTTLLVLSMILLPYVSFDYTLINIYIPLMLFINSDEKTSKSNLAVCILFGLLVIPKHYTIPVMSYFNPINVSLNPLIMLSIMGVILKEGVSELRKKRQSKTILLNEVEK